MAAFPASLPVRLCAAAIALAALASLAVQFRVNWVEMGDDATTGAVLWKMARYFTILTNLAVAAALARVAWRGAWPGAAWPAALTVWIVAVGAVYHALLAETHHPQGIEVLSNLGFHTVVPLGVLLLWVAAAPKAPLSFMAPLIWTAYPLAYAVYAILRGLSDGIYPYFFLDPAKSGIVIVAAYVLGLGIFFVVLGTTLVAGAKVAGNKREQTA